MTEQAEQVTQTAQNSGKTQTSLEIRHLVKRYANADKPVLDDISFDVPHGKVFVIVGPSGSGKSTLLRTIAGLEPIQGGTIALNGEIIETGKPGTESAGRSKRGSELRTRVGMVFQSYDLFPNKTVLGNITLAPTLVQKRDKAEVEKEAIALLERVGLADRKDAWPHELSGGQRQRVAICRALILHPEVLLFDEVTAALDPEMVREVLDVMLELADSGQTMLIVTHEMQFARAIADQVIMLEDGGIVEQSENRACQAFPAHVRIRQASQAGGTDGNFRRVIASFDSSHPYKRGVTMTASIINKTIKSIVAASAALIMAASVAACGPNAATPSEENNASNGGATTSKVTARSLDEIKKSGVLKVAVFSDKAPFGYIDKDGKNAGYDIVFAERLAKDLGVKVKYTSVDPAARVDVLTSNKVDITLANFTVTDERKEKVDFAKPYMKVALGVVSPENAEITDVSQLKGKTLIIAKGTTAESYFEKNEPDVKLQKYDQYADAYNALLDGRGDAFSTDNTEVLAWAKINKGFKVGITKLGDEDTIAPAVQKGNKELLNWINDEIVKLGKENFFHKDYEETLKPVYGSDVNPDDIVVEGGKL